MDDKIFVFVCMLFGCSILKIVSAHDSGNDGGGGGGSTKLSVVISYETENCYAEKFFKEQLTAQVLEEFTKCGVVRFNFMPCSTSCMANGVLTCRYGECQCASDRIHACAATLYKEDQHQVGKFVICYFNCKDAAKCACESGMKWDTIDDCVKKHNGDRYCNAFFDRIINDWQTELIPGIKFGSKYDANLNDCAAGDFKGVLCTQLKNNNLHCDACPCS